MPQYISCIQRRDQEVRHAADGQRVSRCVSLQSLMRRTMTAVKLALTVLLQGSPWLDDVTRDRAIAKVRLLVVSNRISPSGHAQI